MSALIWVYVPGSRLWALPVYFFSSNTSSSLILTTKHLSQLTVYFSCHSRPSSRGSAVWRIKKTLMATFALSNKSPTQERLSLLWLPVAFLYHSRFAVEDRETISYPGLWVRDWEGERTKQSLFRLVSSSSQSVCQRRCMRRRLPLNKVSSPLRTEKPIVPFGHTIYIAFSFFSSVAVKHVKRCVKKKN